MPPPEENETLSTFWSSVADAGHFVVEGPLLGSVCILGVAANTLATVILTRSSLAPSYSSSSASVPALQPPSGSGSGRDQLDFSPTFARSVSVIISR